VCYRRFFAAEPALPLLLLSFEPLDLEAAWRKAAGKAMLSS